MPIQGKGGKGSSPPFTKIQEKKALRRLKKAKREEGEMLYKDAENLEETAVTRILSANPVDVTEDIRKREQETKFKRNNHTSRPSKSSDLLTDELIDDASQIVSAYDSLLHSFDYKSVHQARKEIKKRQRTPNSDIEESELLPPSKKVKTIQSSTNTKHKIDLDSINDLTDDEMPTLEDVASSIGSDEFEGSNESADGYESENINEENSENEESDMEDEDLAQIEHTRAKLRSILSSKTHSNEDDHEEDHDEDIDEDIDEDDESDENVKDDVEQDDIGELHENTNVNTRYTSPLSLEQISTLSEDTKFIEIPHSSFSHALGSIWKTHRTKDLLLKENPDQIGLREKLVKPWNSLWMEAFYESKDKVQTKKANNNSNSSPLEQSTLKMTETQNALFQLFNSYNDVLYCRRGAINGLEIMATYVLHIVNHITKRVEKILKHSSEISILASKKRKIKEEITMLTTELKKHSKKNKWKRKMENSNQPQELIEDADTPSIMKTVQSVESIKARLSELHTQLRQDKEFRDQGFTKPKVLVILPTRNSALEFVELLMKLMPKLVTSVVTNKNRFYADYYDEGQIPNRRRPLEWHSLFRGNQDDNFKLGISIRNRSMKLFTKFTHSDIIVASPLGLRLSVDEKESGSFDFLSSIELAVFDQCDFLRMQNWEHLQFIFDKLCQMPEKSEDIDFGRVSNIYLEEQSKYFRQTLVFTNSLSVEINSLFNSCLNHTGSIKVRHPFTEGSISKIPSLIGSSTQRHIFYRIGVKSHTSSDDDRFQYFCDHVYPNMQNALGNGTVLFIPSYFDYLRVRRFFKNQLDKDSDLNAVTVCEYTPRPEAIKNKRHFKDAKVPVLIMTEREHFYTRIKVYGIKNIVFYSPPSFGQFYSEFSGWIEEGGSVLTLFTQFDGFSLEAIVGRERCQTMMSSEKSTHLIAI